MKYPIDTEEYIAAARVEFGPDEFAERAYREVIPLVNDAYDTGLKGERGYPVDLDEERRRFAEAASIPFERVCDNFLITGMIQWINSAYAQGRREAAQIAGTAPEAGQRGP